MTLHPVTLGLAILLTGCTGSGTFDRFADQAPDWFRKQPTGYPEPCQQKPDTSQTGNQETQPNPDNTAGHNTTSRSCSENPETGTNVRNTSCMVRTRIFL